MKTSEAIYQQKDQPKKRVQTSFITATIMIALVLLSLGLFCAFALFGSNFIAYAKQSIPMKVFLNDSTSVQQKDKLLAELKTKPYSSSVAYLSKEDASKILLEKTGEDVKKLMGGINPLLASINVQLKAVYVDADSFAMIQKALMRNPIVTEVNYPVKMIKSLNQNGKNFFIISLVMIVVTIFITFYLVVSTIKLSIYSQRLSIRTMQLIGATESFIRAPFLRAGIIQGAIAGIIAVALLCLILVFSRLSLSFVSLNANFINRPEFYLLMLGIVLFGAGLGYMGSYSAVNKYLNQSLDKLI